MGNTELGERARTRVGETLRGKWRLEQLIGVGGMAAVYAATHRNGKRGAVKLLHPEVSLNEEAKSRFLREGYVANKVEHPGAVSVLDDDVAEDGSVFLVMELLDGESVESKLQHAPHNTISEAEALPIIADMLDVLSAAHQKGIVHRDLKPDNVFVTRQGQVKVLDFGIARLREAAQQSGTQTGSIMGTPAFMPPEQALGDWQKVDGRTDVWATGATLFNMLSGRPVHVGESQNKVLLSAMTKPAPPLASLAPQVSPRVAAIVDRALAFERDHRWSSAAEMRDALRACLGAGGVTGGPHVPTAPGQASVMNAPPTVALAQRPYSGAPAPVPQATPFVAQAPGHAYGGHATPPSFGGSTNHPSSGTLAHSALATPSDLKPPKRASTGAWLAGALVLGLLIGAGAFGYSMMRAEPSVSAAAPDASTEALAAAQPAASNDPVPTATTTAVEPTADGSAQPIASASAAVTPSATAASAATGKPATGIRPGVVKPGAPKPPVTARDYGL